MAERDTTGVEFEERVVFLNRVQKVHKGGRTLRHSALVVVGDGLGRVGVGLAKAHEVPDAIRKSAEKARRNLIRVPLIGTTIPHAASATVAASTVIVKPAAPGTGVIAGGPVRAVVEAAGIKDIVTKSLGSANQVNTVRAAMKCLGELRVAEEVASLRGKSVEDVLGPQSASRAAAAEGSES